jgi:hypothetical protein
VTRWINIFRTGQHTDMNGNQQHWTAADLDRILNTHDPNQMEVPLVLGHPKVHDPAHGWVMGLRRVGDYLQAQFTQVSDAVKEAVRAGRYKYVSISLLPGGKLKHVGLLGGAVPAVPGLGAVDLEDAGIQHFSMPMEGNTMDMNDGNTQSRILTPQEVEELVRETYAAQAQAVAIFENLRSRLRSAGAAFAAGNGYQAPTSTYVDLTRKV